MPIGTSDGLVFPDETSMLLHYSGNSPQNDLSQEANQGSSTPDKQPPTATGKPTDAFKSETGTTLAGTSDSEVQTHPKDIWDKLKETWPAKLGEGLWNAGKTLATMGHDAYYNGMTEDEMIKKSSEAAGLLMGGGIPMAEKGALGLFGGRMTKEAVDLAQRMEDKGLHPSVVKQVTGLERGTDNLWRREFSDSESKINPGAFTNQGSFEHAKLGDLFDHPELYKAYPEAKNLDVFSVKQVGSKDGTLGLADPWNNQILLKEGMAPEETKSILLHEIQHIIQYKEGFSFGTTENLPSKLIDQYKGFLIKRYGQETVDNIDHLNYVGKPEAAEELAKRLLNNADYKLYRALGTETEARNVQTRMNYTPEEIRNTLGSHTEDIERTHQIVQLPKEKPYIPTR